jgi:ABC transporter substrate binding protein
MPGIPKPSWRCARFRQPHPLSGWR